MQTLAHLLINRRSAWAVVIITLLLSAFGLYQSTKLQHEDDLLAFLPKDDPDVRDFRAINQLFGGLDLALVGISAEDALDTDFLERLQRATREIKGLPGLRYVLSLTNVQDFTPNRDEGGIVADNLVTKLPANDQEREALRDKVMSRDAVVGNLISADGKAVQIYCFLNDGTEQKAMAKRIHHVVSAVFPDNDKYWGGGPFISTYIYNTTQRDLRRLTPWAVLTIVVILLISFRDIKGTLLALLSTGIGIVVSLGLMASFGVRFNLVLGSMPVILFALGSAYGIHVLARYYALVEGGGDQAIVRTLTGVGPTVLAAGLTTAASLLSFVAMDIRPMRTFGLFTALGILITLILSLTFIPAVAVLMGLKSHQNSSGPLRRALVRLILFAQGHRLAVGTPLVAIALVGAVFTARVDNSVDMTAFFSPQSPPDKAAQFLRGHFGGDQFIQLHVEGDMNDPEVLREVQRVADGISLLPHVTSVLHVGQVIHQINEALAGQRRIPENMDQAKLLYSFLEGDPSLDQLVTQDRKQALLHIKVDSNHAADLEALLGEVEAWTGREALRGYRRVAIGGPDGALAQERVRGIVAARIQAEAHHRGLTLSPERVERLKKLLATGAPQMDPEPVRHAALTFLRSEENAVELPRGEADPTEAVAAGVVALGPDVTEEALVRELAGILQRPAKDPLVDDLAFSLAAPLAQAWRDQRASQWAETLAGEVGLTGLERGKQERLTMAVASALLDMEVPFTFLAASKGAEGALKMTVNGLPVLHRGLSRSATRNQIQSLIFALLLVTLILAVLYRSLPSGLLAISPTLITLLVIYGGMGLVGVHLDMGTAMLASIILGAGVDYGVHLVSAWRAPPQGSLADAAAVAAQNTGSAIWTNAITVCAGFFVLTLGEARPLQNVGGLTAAAMLTAAAATFLVIPILARKGAYTPPPRETELVATTDEAILSKADSL